MAALLTAVNELIDAVRGQTAFVAELNDLSQKVGGQLRKAQRGEVHAALRQLAGLFPNVPLVALGHVAISCGSLLEIGGDPGSPAAPVGQAPAGQRDGHRVLQPLPGSGRNRSSSTQ